MGVSDKMLELVASFAMSLKGMCGAPILGALILFYYLHPIISLYECVAGGIVLGYCLAAWLSYICCAAVGGTSAIAIRFSYTVITVISLYYAYKIYLNNRNL